MSFKLDVSPKFTSFSDNLLIVVPAFSILQVKDVLEELLGLS